MINSKWLFPNKCGECRKPIATPSLNRQGDLPLVFCNRACESKYRSKKTNSLLAGFYGEGSKIILHPHT